MKTRTLFFKTWSTQKQVLDRLTELYKIKVVSSNPFNNGTLITFNY
jgi:hypothetical protein